VAVDGAGPTAKAGTGPGSCLVLFIFATLDLFGVISQPRPSSAWSFRADWIIGLCAVVLLCARPRRRSSGRREPREPAPSYSRRSRRCSARRRARSRCQPRPVQARRGQLDGLARAGTTVSSRPGDAERLSLIELALAEAGPERVIAHIGAPTPGTPAGWPGGGGAGGDAHRRITPYYLPAPRRADRHYLGSERPHPAGVYAYIFPNGPRYPCHQPCSPGWRTRGAGRPS